MANSPRSGTAEIKHGDQTYTASYTVARGMITVSGAFGSRTTQLSGATAEALAKLLLAEMVDQGRGK
jgi:hypothetical protein